MKEKRCKVCDKLLPDFYRNYTCNTCKYRIYGQRKKRKKVGASLMPRRIDNGGSIYAALKRFDKKVTGVKMVCLYCRGNNMNKETRTCNDCGTTTTYFDINEHKKKAVKKEVVPNE